MTNHPNWLGIIIKNQDPQFDLENFPYGAGIFNKIRKVINPNKNQKSSAVW